MKGSELMKVAIVAVGAAGMSMFALPAKAAPVVQWPAACQAMHPDANCLNHGPGNPQRYYGYVSPSFYNYDGPGYPAYFAYAPEPVQGPVDPYFY